MNPVIGPQVSNPQLTAIPPQFGSKAPSVRFGCAAKDTVQFSANNQNQPTEQTDKKPVLQNLPGKVGGAKKYALPVAAIALGATVGTAPLWIPLLTAVGTTGPLALLTGPAAVVGSYIAAGPLMLAAHAVGGAMALGGALLAVRNFRQG